MEMPSPAPAAAAVSDAGGGADDPAWPSRAACLSLALCAFQAAVALALSRVVGGRWQLPPAERWVVAWLLYDAVVHITLEGPFVCISLVSSVAESDSVHSMLWKEYGRADSRWLHSDPTVVALEILTVAVAGPLALLLVFAIVQDKHYRHFVQVCLCVCELYGGWMTFAPEWLAGSASLRTDSPDLLWLYLVFFNGLWVLLPIVLLAQSWGALAVAHRPRVAKAAGGKRKRR
uniref:Emopamil-binding protein-like n=1 Tax=Petromyzon marinus TaxID=7757 RepID=A0AAJ7SJJ9_PETMA|nr:emopamil-binding protein-like [Petromyzon marinus]